MSLQEQLGAARARCETLKRELEKLRGKHLDTTLVEQAAEVEPFQRFSLRERRTLRGHFSKVYTIAWAPDSRGLISGSQDGKLIVWNSFTTMKVHAIPLRNFWVMTSAFSPSGDVVASGGLDNNCSIYRLTSRENPLRPARELVHHSGYVSCCRFLSKELILTSSGDMTCILWNAEGGEVVSKFIGHGGDIMYVSPFPFPNHTNFLSASCDGTVKNWSLNENQCVKTFHVSAPNQRLDVNVVQVLPNNFSFVTGDENGTCRIWDIRGDTPLMEYPLADYGSVTTLSVSKSGRLLFVGYEEHPLIVWDILKGKNVQVFDRGHDARVSCVTVAPDGYAVATGGWDNLVKVWC